MPGQHALLSPSSANIWLHCTRAPRLCEQYPETETEYTRQGTDAHELCQYKLESLLGIETHDPRGTLEYYDEEMEACSEDYAAYVSETINEITDTCPDPTVLIEQKLDFSRYVPDGFGRGDCIIIADGTMHVIDFKYGVGVLVSAERNPQMMLYALGAIELLDDLYDFDSISLTIFQPRRENVSTWVISKAELITWANDVLVPAAKLAYAGEGEFCAGDHCMFCKAKATCRKRAEYNLSLASYDFAKPDELEELEIAAILDRVDQLISWAEDVKAYALTEALRGVKYDGFKVVEDRSIRKYTDEDAVATAVIAEGKDPYEKKLRGITDMTALLGKKDFERILGKLVCKPAGKPTLVKDSDKRPEYTNAQTDFNE